MDELNPSSGAGAPAEPVDAGAPMTFEVTPGEGSAVVRITGELDIANVDELERGVAQLMENPPRLLILDVAALRFADSSAISLWLRWAALVERVQLRDTPALLRRVITSMGLAEQFELTS